MDPKRQGEVALKLVRHFLRKRPISLSQESMRELGNVAKAIGLSVEELMQFAKPLMQEVMDECFVDSGIKITPRKSEN